MGRGGKVGPLNPQPQTLNIVFQLKGWSSGAQGLRLEVEALVHAFARVITNIIMTTSTIIMFSTLLFYPAQLLLLFLLSLLLKLLLLLLLQSLLLLL